MDSLNKAFEFSARLDLLFSTVGLEKCQYIKRARPFFFPNGALAPWAVSSTTTARLPKVVRVIELVP